MKSLPRAIALSVCIALSGASACGASPVPPAPQDLACLGPACRQGEDLQVLDRDTGLTLPVYWHEGQRWIAGQPGHRYAITIRNRTGARRLAVVSVDGINAVTGESAGWNQGGYVLAPRESYGVLGWRKSEERVADFLFTDVSDAYATRTGRAGNVGVIGVAFFREWVPPPVAIAVPAPGAVQSQEQTLGAARAAAPSAAAERDALPGLGTGHGEAEASPVATTEFRRAQELPDVVISIRYDRPERLMAMGILPRPSAPQPFPQSASTGFVPDPPIRR